MTWLIYWGKGRVNAFSAPVMASAVRQRRWCLCVPLLLLALMGRGLAVPAQLTDGRVVVARRPSRPGISAVEVDTTLSVETNSAESVFHLRIGARRPVEVVRAADSFYVEVDQQGGLAGFWMTNVPPFSSFEGT